MIFLEPSSYMPAEVIYAADIQPFKSIVEALNGTGQFCIAIPDYKVDGIPAVDPKRYLEIIAPSQNGAMVQAPEIWVRPLPTRPFTRQYAIAWTTQRGVKKNYFIMKLFNTTQIADKNRHRFIILPSNPEGASAPDDANLLVFDSQLAMIMNVLFIAKILKINLGTYRDLTDNTKFFAKFAAECLAAISKLADTQLGPEDFKIPKDYLASFTIPPIYRSMNKQVAMVKEIGKPKSQIKTLWDCFYDIYTNLDLESRLPQWSQVIKPNSGAMPSFRWLDTLNKKTNARSKNFDSRIEIQLKLAEGDKGYNPRIKDYFVTKFANGAKKAPELMTPHNLPMLWGSDNTDPNRTKGAAHTGCIFLTLQLEYKFYSSGNPTTGWRADQLALQPISGGGGNTYDDAMAFFDDDGDNDNQYNAVTEENPI